MNKEKTNEHFVIANNYTLTHLKYITENEENLIVNNVKRTSQKNIIEALKSGFLFDNIVILIDNNDIIFIKGYEIYHAIINFFKSNEYKKMNKDEQRKFNNTMITIIEITFDKTTDNEYKEQIKSKLLKI